MPVKPAERRAAYRQQGWWSDARITDLFDANARARPDALALVDPPNRAALVGGEPLRLSYAELERMAAGYALRMLDLGLRRGDRLVTQVPNIAEYPAIYFAALRLGVIISPVPMQFRRREIEQIVGLTEARAVLTVPIFKGEPADAGTRAAAEAHGAQWWLLGPAVERGVQGFVPLDATAADRQRLAARLRDEPVLASDVATLCWTSGTEGVPKGVPRTHDHWLAISNFHFEGAGIRPGDVLLNPFPLVNMAALGGCFMSWLRSGGTLVLHHPLDLPVFLGQIASERPHYTIAPPAVLNMLIRDEALLRRTDLTSLRCIGSGSAPLDPAMIRGFRDRFGIEIVNVFGSNEGMSLLSTAVEAPEPEMRARFFPRFGRPEVHWPTRAAAAFETRLVDPETHEEVHEPCRPAEMQIRGPGVFEGYYRAPARTAESFTADGYFRTGDLFEIAEDTRYYRFVGRLKELIVRGGMKIAPDDVDALLLQHPGIAEAAVVGYPDPVLGERLCAVVVPRPGAGPVTLASVQEHLHGLGLATFKWPERIREVAALPRNAVGKVIRRELASVAMTPDQGTTDDLLCGRDGR